MEKYFDHEEFGHGHARGHGHDFLLSNLFNENALLGRHSLYHLLCCKSLKTNKFTADLRLASDINLCISSGFLNYDEYS